MLPLGDRHSTAFRRYYYASRNVAMMRRLPRTNGKLMMLEGVGLISGFWLRWLRLDSSAKLLDLPIVPYAQGAVHVSTSTHRPQPKAENEYIPTQ